MSPAAQTAEDGVILTGMDAARPSEPTGFAPAGSSRPESSPRDGARERPLYFAAQEPQARASQPSLPPACEAPSCTLNLTDSSAPLLPEAQRRWAARSLTERLQPLRRARHWMAAHPEVFAKAISPDLVRSQADTLVTELLPLLDAIRFLERNAQKLLAPRGLGRKHRPLWLTGVHAQVHRDPLGHILVIGPANFPLFLPGVQTLQALLAGNAVTWKPGSGGVPVALLLAHVLHEAGLPRGILHITDESVEAAQAALAQRPDKVIFTGSFDAGRKVLQTLARTATPATMELSGTDAVVVLPSADLPLTAKAVAFGLRLNGAEVCMSPRRLVATRETLNRLRPLLQAELARLPEVQLKPQTADLLQSLITRSQQQGAIALTPPSAAFSSPDADSHDSQRTREQNSPALNTWYPLPEQGLLDPASGSGGTRVRPLLIDHATPDTAITRTDLFAPVLSLIEAASVLHLADIVNNNPYGLTAAIFGNPREAQTLAAQLRVGTVLINDLIAPTADPRVPFGGRGASGFGVTRGMEGLLEMTAAKVVLTRRKGSSRHYDPLRTRDVPLFAGLIGALHGGSLGQRWRSLQQVVSAVRSRRSGAPQS